MLTLETACRTPDGLFQQDSCSEQHLIPLVHLNATHPTHLDIHTTRKPTEQQLLRSIFDDTAICTCVVVCRSQLRQIAASQHIMLVFVRGGVDQFPQLQLGRSS